MRDPRHPDGRVESPFAHPFTADGVHVSADETWTPRIMSGRIVDRRDGRIDIVAGDQADRLAERVRRRAEAEGKTADLGDWRIVVRTHCVAQVRRRAWSGSR